MPPKKGQSLKASGSNPKSIPVEDSSHIVFGDDKKKGKKGKSQGRQPVEASELPGPPKPTARQVIGGASWTGKLPVNLLSELCQRQKWNKPDYSMRQCPGRDGHDKMYRSEVTLSKKDPKTQEMTTLPTFRTPETLVPISEEPSALEARHFAAAYALFRVNSMKNLSMALPPKYRDLWRREFQQIKKEDEEKGKAWLYDADPFAAEQKRKEIHLAMEKRKVEQEKKQEALAKNPGLALMQNPKTRGWEAAPKIEMGSKIRTKIEILIRENAVWNPYGVVISRQESSSIVTRLTSRGFRSSHVEEAIQYCKNEEEVLDWLLIHVPEEDLPLFALPSNYTAGVSLVSDDLARESRLKRLAAAGYQQDLCAQALRACDGNEHEAAFWLQNTLFPSSEGSLNDDIASEVEWGNEKMALEAIYDDRFASSSPNECIVNLESAKFAQFAPVTVRFIIPTSGYPYELPAVLVSSTKIPAYIRLSIAKQALQFAGTNFAGEPMIYNLCEWLESNLEHIIDNPVSLTELHLLSRPSVGATLEHSADLTLPSQKKKIHADKRTNEEVFATWKERQSLPAQQRMTKARQNLPAWSKQEAINGAIQQHRVTIITGETGSGKSTQVVQFVLDEAIRNSSGASTRLLCTQPRRVAALSLADRVCSERCVDVGDEVGYMIRGESRISAATKITFMTTGILLRRLQTSSDTKQALEGISHVFIDEVHERSLDTDFLLALLKDSLQACPQLKIVLMSATLDKDIFSDYFGGSKEVAHVHIEGRTFPVADIYLEEILQTTKLDGVPHEINDASIGKAISALGNGINYDLIKSLITQIDQELGEDPGAILIFLPGTLEIDKCIRTISTVPHVLPYPLHASLLPSDQRKVFPPAPVGRRKVIAATNVAETSITIEDVVAVIDTGRVKETNYDVQNNIVRLQEVWASRAACKQRRGRAGRVKAGKCYKLFSQRIEENMAAKSLPEIQRVPLEQLCLGVKATGKDRDISAFLSSLITPPEEGAISNALTMLRVMGALDDDRLTALGTYMSMIPADLRCAKLVVLGSLFDCLEPCLTIAAILTVKDPFVSPRDKREEADAAKALYPSQHGDLILSLFAYEEFAAVSQDLNHRRLQSWCNERFLSLTTLRDITSTRSQLLDSLKDANLVALDYYLQKSSLQTHSPLLLRALIAASLQPQIAEIKFPDKKYMQSLSGTKELDPEAKTIKYFIPSPPSLTASTDNANSTTNNPETSQAWQRVFIHPSSPLFHSTSSSFTTGPTSATYLSYFSKLATGATQQKTYIHSLTPLNTYTQLLFGSSGIKIDTQVPGGGLRSGNFKIRGWARIGVLVSRLRVLLDRELSDAIDRPAAAAGSSSFADSEVVKVAKWLIELNGQDR